MAFKCKDKTAESCLSAQELIHCVFYKDADVNVWGE